EEEVPAPDLMAALEASLAEVRSGSSDKPESGTSSGESTKRSSSSKSSSSKSSGANGAKSPGTKRPSRAKAKS
ncbi:MAG TPA: hypothetical protein VGF68_14650, partial [Solirubrobacteraceae bacterium]